MSSDFSDSDDEDFKIENELNSDDDEIEKGKVSGTNKRKKYTCSGIVSKFRKESDDSNQSSEENLKETSKQESDNLWEFFLKDSDQASIDKSNAIEITKQDTAKLNNTDKSLSSDKQGKISKLSDVGSIIKASSSNNSKPNLNSLLNSNKLNNRGLSNALNQLGKSKKISTLDKSKQDWSAFKKREGLDEDIETHNKGKDGYVYSINLFMIYI